MSRPDKISPAEDLLTSLTKNPTRVIIKALIVLALFIALSDCIAQMNLAWMLVTL